MMNKIQYIITEDTFSKDFIIKNISKKFYGYLKSTNSIFFVNNKEVSLDIKLKKNDIYEIHYFNKEKETKKVNKEISILYEDEDLIILDKPAELLTIPSKYEEDSLYSRLIYHKEGSLNILTRLDKETKGIVVVAKKHYLVNKINITNKEYITKLSNHLPNDMGIIELPIKKTSTIKRVIDSDGVNSITKYKLINKEKNIYQMNLVTGKTHQIRVHTAYFNCSIVGDSIYGVKDKGLMLICKKVNLIHPITKKEIEVVSNYELE